MTRDYDSLERRIADWARTRADVRAVVLVGSRARVDQPADQWSDLDALIFFDDRSPYIDDGRWLESFGDRWLSYLDHTGPGDAEWFAIYDGGLKADFVVLDAGDPADELPAMLARFPYQDVFRRGARVLYDRRDPQRIYSLPARPPAPKPAPTAAQFDHVVNGFLLEATKTAKFIRRGDLWRAANWFARDLRTRLLTMIEWHAGGSDVWYDGRFIDQWADPRVLEALPATMPHYTQPGMKAALLASLDLFRWLSREIAQRQAFARHSAGDKIAALIAEILAPI